MSDAVWPGWTALTQPLFQMGGASVSAATLLGALGFVIGVWWLASALERNVLRLALQRSGDSSDHGARSRVHMISRLLRYAVWLIGTLIGLNQLGIDLSSVTLLGSAFAVGLGFGLQNVVGNFVSGLIILVERSLQVGDFVDLESGVRGRVREIAMRYTRVTTNDEIDVLVPNSEFINKRVINWTLDNAHRRIRVPFGVAYGTSKERVREAGVAAALAVPHVLRSPGREPTVWLTSYGDSALNFELVVWADRELTMRPAATHAKLMWALDDELGRRGIEIPFPQRDLHVRSGALEVRLAQPPVAPAGPAAHSP